VSATADRRPARKSSDPSRTRSSAGDAVAGIRISHPDRLIYPDLAITKLQFAQYFASVADWFSTHIKGRPLTLVHCPAGIAAPCMFMKYAKQWGPTRSGGEDSGEDEGR
jgi:bifunctional non-homologous end joining protein LigD